MPDGDLRHLVEVEEISIGFTRPDGSTGSTPVWVVQAGDAIFVRSIHGRCSGWYRRLRASPDGELGDGAHTHPYAPVHRLPGITPQRPRFDTVRAAVRLSFRAHICGLVQQVTSTG